MGLVPADAEAHVRIDIVEPEPGRVGARLLDPRSRRIEGVDLVGPAFVGDHDLVAAGPTKPPSAPREYIAVVSRDRGATGPEFWEARGPGA